MFIQEFIPFIEDKYRVRQGGHEWSYWRSGLVDGLKFISETFHR